MAPEGGKKTYKSETNKKTPHLSAAVRRGFRWSFLGAYSAAYNEHPFSKVAQRADSHLHPR